MQEQLTSLSTGVVSRSNAFNMAVTLGISSVPFREYVNTGLSLSIPAIPVTSHMSW